MRKLMLFFTALMLTLGVKAQAQMMTSQELEQQGLSKGYYTFEAEVLKDKMKRITTADELKVAGKNIVIQHCHEGTDYQGEEGSFLTMQSLADQYGYHSIFMQEKPIGVGIFTTEGTEYFENVKTQMNWETWQTDTIVTIGVKTKLQTSHGRLTGSTCYVAQPMTDGTLRASKTEEADVYQFIQATDGKWQIKSTAKDWFLYVQKNGNSSQIEVVGTLDATQKKNSYFYIYEIEDTKTDTYGEIKYVECDVTLTAPSGNTFTMTQKGWSDFYEFYILPPDTIKTSVYLPNNYGVTLSNIFYHETSNEITGRVKFPFTVSGVYAKIPLHLNVPNNEDKRLTVGDNNTVKFITKPEPESAEWENWYNNQNNQWYIFPRLDEKRCFEYYIQNVKTEKYIYVEASGAVILSDTPTYFKLNEGATTRCVKFATAYNANNAVYLGNLHESNGGVKVSNEHGATKSLLVTTISGEELGGEDAIGFVRRYTRGTSFWDGGQISPEAAPVELKEVFESTLHEGKDSEGSTHLLYCAETGITVTKLDNVTATFEFTLNAGDQLAILGVDIVNNVGEAEYADYHFGTAGLKPQNNTYTVYNVFPGSYTLRYWVCHRTDNEDGKNHNLNNTSGKITVTGADYRIMFSQPLVNGTFAAQTTWFRLRLSDGLEKYISAQPAYMDAENNLMVTNNTPSNDYAGLWAVIGDEKNGYKFYNRAWGPEYAMKTEGENGSARTYMVPAAEASTYDIVQQDRSTKDYKFYVKLHGTANNYLQNFGGYNGTGHLSTWNSEYALGDDASVMTFETVNEEGFADRTETVKNALVANWNPWIGHTDVSKFVTSISDSFAQLMLKRNDFSILDGKVFKFVNKAEEGDARRGRVLRVDADNNMAGVVSQGNTIDDFLQIVDNGDGTFKLLHLATNKYFQLPSAHTITENAEDAAVYSYKVYGNEEQALCFVSGNEMMHLGNWGYSYTTINHNNIEAGASRWDVICDVDAQKLSDLITQAKELYAATQEAAYQANVGVPGYANAESTTALDNTINGLAGKTFDDAETALTNAMTAVTAAEKKVFFPTDCYFTITNVRGSVIYDEENTSENRNDDYLWYTTSVNATNPNHLWGFYYDEETEEYYLYNVGKVLFANSKGKGSYYGDTWIFSTAPVAITMEAMDAPFFHIKGDGKTMSVSTGLIGPVIAHYENGDQGIPMQFKKGAVEFNEDLLDQLDDLSAMQLKPGFYTLSCGDGLYLNDDVVVGDNMRSLTALTSDKIKNIFYLTEDQELVGYASGYGFTYANCNTGKPEVGYNTFTFSKAAGEGEYLVKADDGKSVKEWADRYLTAKDGKLVVNDGVKKDATAWKIEAVTELPVKLTHASKNRGAYGTIYSPVALKLVDGVRAYTGYVTTEDGENVLVLEEFTGVIPANTGAVLWQPEATDNVVVNLPITDEAGSVSKDNKLVGWVFTQANPDMTGAYYSLGKKDNLMAFYNYTGANLSGFRARIAKNAQMMATKSLRMRFQEATAIEEIISILQNNEVYDLNGRRVMTPAKGLYIVNGKKVFIK